MHREQRQAVTLILTQFIFVLVVAALACLSSVMLGYSILLGGLCSIIPGIYFARQLFRYLHAQSAKQMMRAFYLGEIIKLVMIGLLSVLVFRFIPILPVGFFVGFILSQLAFWFAPHFIARKVVGGAQ